MKLCISGLSLLILISASIAQEVSIDDVIYQEGAQLQTTTHINEALPNTIAFEMIKIHLHLSNQEIVSINPEEESLAILQGLEELTKTDIIDGLTITTNKEQMLTDYLTQTSNILTKSDTLISFIRQEIVLLKLDMNACLVDKSITDKEYFTTINNYDQAGSEKALQSSIISDACASQNRIQYNAKTYLLERIVFFTSVLQQKYDLLFNNQDTIINHFDVISDSMLTKLNAINESLKLYQF